MDNSLQPAKLNCQFPRWRLMFIVKMKVGFASSKSIACSTSAAGWKTLDFGYHHLHVRIRFDGKSIAFSCPLDDNFVNDVSHELNIRIQNPFLSGLGIRSGIKRKFRG